MQNPKISIITIAYNCENEIEDTIKSVISQSYSNKEYIIIDGASTDNTMTVVNQYKDKIDVIVSEPDKGRSDAFNKGIQKACGDYIVMMNAGDMLTDNALEQFALHFEPGYDVIKGNTLRWNPKTRTKFREKPVIDYPSIPFNFLVCHQSTYISKSAYEKYGNYLENFHVAMDLELMLRYTRLGARFHSIDADLALFRMGGISQTSVSRRYYEMRQAMVLNGRNIFQTNLFMTYIHIRTWTRIILNKINPDLKSKLIEVS
jgi:glycosyltransferase involved in cell wall biosynthesis